MTEAQRRVLQEKADALRRTVESALPSRVAATPGQRSRSIADLAVFRRGAALLTEVREAGDGVLASDLRSRTEGLLEAALLSLAEAVQQYDRELKLAALNRARGHLARVAALLLLRTGMPPADPVFSWVVAVETEVIPAVAGLARWADGLGRRGR